MNCVHGNDVLVEHCAACEAAGRVVFPASGEVRTCGLCKGTGKSGDRMEDFVCPNCGGFGDEFDHDQSSLTIPQLRAIIAPPHPALPVIARWLVEYPDGDEALVLVIDRHIALLEQFFRGPFRPEVVRAHAAIKALLGALRSVDRRV